MMKKNSYIPFLSAIEKVRQHTETDYTFTMTYEGEVLPGQFFEVSLPKYGEAPISVSGIGPGTVDMTIRRVGKVTAEVFEQYEGDHLYLRGPYGNGFDVKEYEGKEVVIIAGGTGLSPVREVVNYLADHPQKRKNFTLIAGFKSPSDILFTEDLERWEKTSDVILTVDGAPEGYKGKIGLVTEYIQDLPVEDLSKAAAIVVGPPPMMKFTVMGLLKKGFLEENIWISHERKMCCGIGKCGHCKVNDTYICLDGPVFKYTEGKNLVD